MSRGLRWTWCCRCRYSLGLGPGLSLGLRHGLGLRLAIDYRLSLGLSFGLWHSPRSLVMSTLPKLGVGDAGRLVEVVADTLGIVGLTASGMMRALTMCS